MQLDNLPVIGKLPPEEIALRLKAIGDLVTAEEVLQSGTPGGSLELFGLGSVKPWLHTAQQIGFIGLVPPHAAANLPIESISSITSDTSLKNKKINIRLDRLHIYDYPGQGIHQVLLIFKARNQLTNASEPVTFSQTYRVQHGQTAAVVGYPVFVGLNTGSAGVAFELFIINIKNETDTALLGIIDSDTFRNGLDLLSSFQPVLKPFTELVLGLASSMLKRHENMKVQEHYLGLDFSTAAMGARLAEGNYIVAQVPSENSILWGEWVFNRATGGIMHQGTGTPLPYNYLVLRVERHSQK